ncbi:MAG TPA: class I lanthipeptide [Kofleriaceae bacterium]|nr:class I lanthipeptide [Kofleriaceae bacterium]
MKKIKTRLQLTKTTVRVLQDADLAAVRGGGGGALLRGRASSDDPAVCVVGGAYGADGGEKL